MWPNFCSLCGVVNASFVQYCSALFSKKLLLLAALILCLLNTGRAQGRPAEAIEGAIKSGNAAAVSRYFGPSVDITLNNSTSTYSRTQGEQVLRDFFARNAVRDFDIDYSGASTSSNSSFTVGTLQTVTGKYKVYLSLRPSDGGFVLKEVRIEK